MMWILILAICDWVGFYGGEFRLDVVWAVVRNAVGGSFGKGRRFFHKK